MIRPANPDDSFAPEFNNINIGVRPAYKVGDPEKLKWR
jgi:hypothetical protein